MKKSEISKESRAMTRRSFLNKAAAGTAGITIVPFLNDPGRKEKQDGRWTADAGKYKFHLIGQAHIDPVWLWPWTEGIAVVHSTFRSALDRMNETSDFAFTASSAQFYQWIAENDPEMLKEIRKRVEEGRWNVVGGWWVEPDMNIPCGEAMARQGLYGQLTLQKLLGRRATVAFNPDSFGHTGTLPQIIRLQGMEDYVFMRPGIKEKNIPADLFWWEGPDGTRVLAYRIPVSYNDSRSVRTRVELVLEQFRDQPFRTFMTYYGAGDHGGGATKENIASVKEIQQEKDAPVLIFSTPERYFREIYDDTKLQLPVVKDDLQHHAVGCYTAESEIKKSNRTAEYALITAEKIAAAGSCVWDFTYPRREFTSAWERVLFLQFHDSLAGTSVPEHSQASREGFGYALDTAHQIMYKAVQKLEWNIPSEDPESQYLLAFNPHAWEVNGKIEYDFNWDLKKPSLVEDERGTPVDHQWTAGSTETGSRKRLVIRPAIPAFGYRQFRLRGGESVLASDKVTVFENGMENKFIRMTISKSGAIGITDKVVGKAIFSGGETGCRALIIDDPSDTWSHDIKSFSKEIGTFGNAQITIIERGPLRAILRVATTYGSSMLTVDWILYADHPFPEAKVTLNWHERLKMLKFSFPVNAESAVATYETPYGFITRPSNGDEEPGQRWIDVTGKNGAGSYGLAVINNAKYGYSVNSNDLRISVARSAVYAHHIPRILDPQAEHIWQDQGIQTFRMLLVPHQGIWQKANIPRIAEEFITPPVLIYQGIHKGKMAKSGKLISINPENIIMTSMKQSENSDDLVIRCVETSGMKASAEIDLSFMNRNWKGNFRPCEIKSLRLNWHTGEIREVNLLEE